MHEHKKSFSINLMSMDDNMRVSLVNDVLSMAIEHRNPPMGL